MRNVRTGRKRSNTRNVRTGRKGATRGRKGLVGKEQHEKCKDWLERSNTSNVRTGRKGAT